MDNMHILNQNVRATHFNLHFRVLVGSKCRNALPLPNTVFFPRMETGYG